MNYILPLEKERQKYHFEMSSDGKELADRGIKPITLNEGGKLNNRVVYVESPFQYGEFFELTNFNEASLDKWKEILKELSSKIGAKNIKTTLLIEKENSKKVDDTNKTKVEIDGSYKGVEAGASAEYENSIYKNEKDTFKSSLEFELELKGKKQSVEVVSKWIEDKKINLENNFIFRSLFENFKNDNLSKYKETKKVEQILRGLTEVNNTLEAIAKVKSPLFSAEMNTVLTKTTNKEFRRYERIELIIEIIF